MSDSDPCPEEDDYVEDEGSQDSYARSTSGSPTPEPTESSLDQAIRTAPVGELRSLLSSICSTNVAAKVMATRTLLAPLDKTSSLKRKMWELCKHCGDDYQVEHNANGDCRYHSGKKELDDEADIWTDHDPDVHGQFDDFEDDPNFAEGFRWTCCEKPADADGCVLSRHKPSATFSPPAKRVQAEPPSFSREP